MSHMSYERHGQSPSAGPSEENPFADRPAGGIGSGGAPSPYDAPPSGGAQPYDPTPAWAIRSQPTGPGQQPTEQFSPGAYHQTQPFPVSPDASHAPDPSRPAEPSDGGLPPGPPPTERRSGWRSPAVLIPLVLVCVLALMAAGAFVYAKLRGVAAEDAPEGTPTATGKAAELPAGRTWLSGAWTGGKMNAERIKAFGDWRGQPADVVTTYPAYETWDELRNSDWHITTFDGYQGRLSYGLPLQPKNKEGGLGDVADGKYDDVWSSIAKSLVKHKRGDTFVRIGLEANGTWFPWGATAERADRYKAAWRHVQKVMKAEAPDLVFGFDITCGKALEGSDDRMDNLTKLYPGDDVVDIVGCDHYDSYTVKGRNADEWRKTLRPDKAAGLADVADFARQHGKKLAIPEWGLTDSDKDGAGDNSFFIYSMYGYFLQNKDILVYENYFNEPDDYLGSAIWDPVQNPKAAAEYRKLWGAAPNLTQR
jgi:hypothetical protein